MSSEEASTAAINTVAEIMANSIGAGVLALGSMVPSFSGEGSGPTVADFLQVLSQVAQMGGWSDEQQIGIAKCKMIGRAYNFAWHDEEMRAVKKYPEFRDLMLRRFDNEPESLRLEKFMAAKQETKEDVREFASRLRALGAKTIPKFEGAGAAESRAAADSVLQRQLLSLYVNGLRDPVRRYVLSKGPTSFADAVEAAAAEERNEKLVAPGAALRAVDAREEKNETDLLSQRLDRLEKMFADSIALQRAPMERGLPRNTSVRLPMRCWYCNLVGHRIRECRSRIENERGSLSNSVQQGVQQPHRSEERGKAASGGSHGQGN